MMWIATNIGAGSGTTAALLFSLVYFIAQSLETYVKLMAELRAGNLILPPPLAKVQQLPYLAACIKEAECLNPGSAFTWKELSPKVAP